MQKYCKRCDAIFFGKSDYCSEYCTRHKLTKPRKKINEDLTCSLNN